MSRTTYGAHPDAARLDYSSHPDDDAMTTCETCDTAYPADGHDECDCCRAEGRIRYSREHDAGAER